LFKSWKLPSFIFVAKRRHAPASTNGLPRASTPRHYRAWLIFCEIFEFQQRHASWKLKNFRKSRDTLSSRETLSSSSSRDIVIVIERLCHHSCGDSIFDRTVCLDVSAYRLFLFLWRARWREKAEVPSLFVHDFIRVLTPTTTTTPIATTSNLHPSADQKSRFIQNKNGIRNYNRNQPEFAINSPVCRKDTLFNSFLRSSYTLNLPSHTQIHTRTLWFWIDHNIDGPFNENKNIPDPIQIFSNQTIQPSVKKKLSIKITNPNRLHCSKTKNGTNFNILPKLKHCVEKKVYM